MILSFLMSVLLQQAPMADGMRAEGKIYVVVGVLTIILTGIFIYLFVLDRRISKMEKKNQ